jgi:hypothetical protein
MASARIFFALLMLPRVPAAAAAAAPPVEPLGEREPSKPREAIALTMLQELLLLRTLPLVPWLAMGAQGLPQKGASRLLSWLKRSLLMLLCWRLGRQRLKLGPTAPVILPGVLQAERGETGGLAAASLRPTQQQYWIKAKSITQWLKQNTAEDCLIIDQVSGCQQLADCAQLDDVDDCTTATCRLTVQQQQPGSAWTGRMGQLGQQKHAANTPKRVGQPSPLRRRSCRCSLVKRDAWVCC